MLQKFLAEGLCFDEDPFLVVLSICRLYRSIKIMANIKHLKRDQYSSSLANSARRVYFI